MCKALSQTNRKDVKTRTTLAEIAVKTAKVCIFESPGLMLFFINSSREKWSSFVQAMSYLRLNIWREMLIECHHSNKHATNNYVMFRDAEGWGPVPDHLPVPRPPTYSLWGTYWTWNNTSRKGRSHVPLVGQVHHHCQQNWCPTCYSWGSFLQTWRCFPLANFSCRSWASRLLGFLVKDDPQVQVVLACWQNEVNREAG